jgi:hypothetical protein
MATSLLPGLLPDLLSVKNFLIADQTTGKASDSDGSPYSGPVAGITTQYVVQSDNATITADNLNITATTPNVFIHSGSGNDALSVLGVGGSNVLDGSTGSNFLVGGTGSGADTFFVDDRAAPADVYSTVVNFHAGDSATIFGVNATDFTFHMFDNQGAAGSTGLDFAFSQAGHANANVVLAGFSQADLASNKLSYSFGTTAATATAPASDYLLIQGH